MKVEYFTLILFLSMISLGSNAQEINHKTEESKLMELSRQWAQAAQSGNAEKILNYWSEDAILMTPDQGTLKGHAQLTMMLEGAAQIPGFEVNWEPKEARVSKSGELGYVIAHKYFKLPNESGNIDTYYFVEVGIWEKQEDGSWKNTVDIYNPDPSITSLK